MLYSIKKDILYYKKSKKIQSGNYSCVCSKSVSGLIAHEVFGHLSEADVGFKWFEWVEGKTIGSNNLNVVDDGNVVGSGFLPFDDEGIDCRRTIIIKNGVINETLNDIKTCLKKDRLATGNCRFKYVEDTPMIRMSTTYIDKGDYSDYEVLSSVKSGIYIDSCWGSYIDNLGIIKLKPCRAYIIENGTVGRPVLINEIVEDVKLLINKIDMFSDSVEFYNTMFGGCSKRSQDKLRVSFGGPMIRIKEVYVY